MVRVIRLNTLLLLLFSLLFACERVDDSANTTSGPAAKPGESKRLRVGVAFETLQTEYWVESVDAIKNELEKRDMEMLPPAIAAGDPNKQMEQVRNFITQKVDGIIVAPKDKHGVIRMIKDANAAGIPIAIYNRPPAETEDPLKYCTVVADNYAITMDTVTYMCEKAKESGKKYNAMILVGDLGDENSIGRRDGFEDAVKKYADTVTVVSRVPTNWDQEKAKAGVTNALQEHPDINFIFTSSDFLFPSIISALEAAGRYKKIGEEGHVLLGGFDGDATAWRMLREGYLDADGVQDVYFECAQAVQAIVDMKAGKDVPRRIEDKGFVVHQGNLDEAADRMWGAKVAAKQAAMEGGTE